MAELTPYPFARLVARAFRELDREQAVFDLPVKKFFLGDRQRDLAVRFHGRRAATPLGPAAGPHSQMAQNIVLAWLGGSRIVELKTVQVLDELEIPRPCIDVRTIGFNAEWSQELKLGQSLEEYVKASMLIEMLAASGRLPFTPGATDTVFDLSVGYDLAGIRSERVQAFLHGMLDARDTVERLRREIPRELGALRDLDFTTRIAESLTLSTFHGCPPDEIERIVEHLLEDVGLHCVVKLNPTLLGPAELRRILHDVLGYRDLHTPDEAFAKDASWEQAVGFVGRLRDKARGLGLGFGVKLTNTLVVDNHSDFFPPDVKEAYVSGQPLHVLAMHLVRRFRREFGAELPISFSAGIDKHNFADAVALGLVPVTVCTDLLRPGGYGRQQGYLAALGRRMDAVDARSIDELVRRDAVVHDTEVYVEGLERDPRYARAANAKPPKKVGSRLELFDCVTCDICVPVCPNDANFTFVLPRAEVPVEKLVADGEGFRIRREGTIAFEKRHQIGNLADFCNECGNCDVFCPEDGGPYVVKPRFFVNEQDWARSTRLDGFFVRRLDGVDTVLGRIDGRELRLVVRREHASFRGDGFALEMDVTDAAGTARGRADGEVDLTWFHIMDCLRAALLAGDAVNYLTK